MPVLTCRRRRRPAWAGRSPCAPPGGSGSSCRRACTRPCSASSGPGSRCGPRQAAMSREAAQGEGRAAAIAPLRPRLRLAPAPTSSPRRSVPTAAGGTGRACRCPKTSGHLATVKGSAGRGGTDQRQRLRIQTKGLSLPAEQRELTGQLHQREGTGRRESQGLPLGGAGKGWPTQGWDSGCHPPWAGGSRGSSPWADPEPRFSLGGREVEAAPQPRALTRMESTLLCTDLLHGTETEGVRAERDGSAAPSAHPAPATATAQPGQHRPRALPDPARAPTVSGDAKTGMLEHQDGSAQPVVPTLRVSWCPQPHPAGSRQTRRRHREAPSGSFWQHGRLSPQQGTPGAVPLRRAPSAGPFGLHIDRSDQLDPRGLLGVGWGGRWGRAALTRCCSSAPAATCWARPRRPGSCRATKFPFWRPGRSAPRQPWQRLLLGGRTATSAAKDKIKEEKPLGAVEPPTWGLTSGCPPLGWARGGGRGGQGLGTAGGARDSRGAARHLPTLARGRAPAPGRGPQSAAPEGTGGAGPGGAEGHRDGPVDAGHESPRARGPESWVTGGQVPGDADTSRAGPWVPGAP